MRKASQVLRLSQLRYLFTYQQRNYWLLKVLFHNNLSEFKVNIPVEAAKNIHL